MTLKTNHEKFLLGTKWTGLSLAIIILGYLVGGIALLIIHGAFGYNENEWGTPLSQTLEHTVAGAILGLAVGLYQRSFIKSCSMCQPYGSMC